VAAITENEFYPVSLKTSKDTNKVS